MTTDSQPETPAPLIQRSRVYVETTVVSLLTAWPSRDLLIAEQQKSTKEWWDRDRPHFAPCVSQHVWDEASRGDADAARERLAAIHDLPQVAINREVERLAQEMLRAKAFPQKAEADALHVAAAAFWRIPYLLSWNQKHIRNTTMLPVIAEVCLACGCRPPAICSPDELRGPRP